MQANAFVDEDAQREDTDSSLQSADIFCLLMHPEEKSNVQQPSYPNPVPDRQHPIFTEILNVPQAPTKLNSTQPSSSSFPTFEQQPLSFAVTNNTKETRVKDAIRFYQETLEQLRSDVLSLIHSPIRLKSRFLREWTEIQYEDSRQPEGIPLSICVEIQKRISTKQQVLDVKRKRLHGLHMQDARQLRHLYQVSFLFLFFFWVFNSLCITIFRIKIFIQPFSVPYIRISILSSGWNTLDSPTKKKNPFIYVHPTTFPCLFHVLCLPFRLMCFILHTSKTPKYSTVPFAHR